MQYIYLVSIPEPVLYVKYLYMHWLSFDLKCESGTYTHIYTVFIFGCVAECTGDHASCGANSRCSNDTGICSCNNGYVSPSGSQSDCINLDGKETCCLWIAIYFMFVVENSNCATNSCAYCPEVQSCLRYALKYVTYVGFISLN